MGQEEQFPGFGWFKPGIESAEKKRVNDIAQTAKGRDIDGYDIVEQAKNLKIEIPGPTEYNGKWTRDQEEILNQADLYNKIAILFDKAARETTPAKSETLPSLLKKLRDLSSQIEYAQIFAAQRNSKILESADYKNLLKEHADLKQKMEQLRTSTETADHILYESLAKDCRAYSTHLLRLMELPWPSEN